jgi:hypothetical protein
MTEIDGRIKHLERQITKYKRVAVWLARAQADLDALKRVRALLQEDQTALLDVDLELELSLSQAIELALRKSGHKMHIREIQAAVAGLGITAKQAAITNALSRATDDEDPFKDYGKGFYGLKGWKETEDRKR